ncbi:dihydrodipicolinate synthase family protein [uncultured Cohaesibacter sp.]|uniref:dihydrodipicolinate synthase family protein n=1 Tax=uncultured Cohaesibacter sp. TaxID=1002546 RepID=UPI0029C7E82E|nr:dihydrodipicolinate synthase family protein [uncultured Cohaesibacter sp.]
MFRPKGVIAAMLTPFGADRRVNEKETRRLVEFGIKASLDGIFPVSSVGEALHMNFEEKCRCMEIVADQAAGRIPILPGVAAPNPYEAADLAKFASSIGCPAVVASPPYYFKPDDSMVQRFFETIAEKSGVPVILYNIPLFSQPIAYETIRKLCRNKLVAGIKDSSGSMVDFLHFLDIIREEDSDISVLTGREESLVPSLLMGGAGCVTASACIFPEIMVSAYKAWQNKEIEKAVALQKAILPLVRKAMFGAPFPVAFKAALEIRGFEMGEPLLPLSDKGARDLAGLTTELSPMMESALSPWDGAVVNAR